MNVAANKKSVSVPLPAFSKARQHGHAIEAATVNIEILMQSIFDKIDQTNGASPEIMDALAAINCYAVCALTQLAEVTANRAQMMDIIHDAMQGGCHA